MDSCQAPLPIVQDTINSMRDSVISLDRRGKIIILNPAAENLLGIQAQETVGRSFSETLINQEELESLNDCILEAIYDPTTPHVSEISINRSGQKVQHLVVRTNLLKTETDEPVGVVAVIADVSERVRLLEERVEQKRTQHQFGQFFLYLLSIYVIGTLANYLLHTYLNSLNVYGEFFKWAYLAILLVPSLITIRIMKIPFSTLGMTLANWKKSLIEGVIASVGLLLLGSLLIMILRHFSMVPFEQTPLVWAGVLPYYFHSFLQELLGRGVMQSSFERFFDDRKGFKAVLLTSIFGGLLHIHFGLLAVAITFVASLIFGAFYLRHHNLIGVTLVHGTLGIFAFVSGLL